MGNLSILLQLFHKFKIIQKLSYMICMYFLQCCRLSFHSLDGIIFTFHYLICLPTDWVNPINSTSPFSVFTGTFIAIKPRLYLLKSYNPYLRTAPALNPSTDYPFWTYFTCHSEVFSAAPSAHIWSSDSTFARVGHSSHPYQGYLPSLPVTHRKKHR